MREYWKDKDRPCAPCRNCGAELYEQFWGNGGWAPAAKATDEIHSERHCIARLKGLIADLESKDHTGEVSLSVKDKMAQDLLWEYAARRRALDLDFSVNLKAALRAAMFDPSKPNGMPWEMAMITADRAVQWAAVLVNDLAGWSGSSGNWPLQEASSLLHRVTEQFDIWSGRRGSNP